MRVLATLIICQLVPGVGGGGVCMWCIFGWHSFRFLEFYWRITYVFEFHENTKKKQIYCETLVWHWFNSLNTISFVGYSNNSLVIFDSIMCVWVCDFTPTSVRLTWLCICINPYVKYAPYIFRCGSALVAFAAKRVDDEYTIYIYMYHKPHTSVCAILSLNGGDSQQ